MPISQGPTPAELESHPVVARDAWVEARKELLSEEKLALRQLDEISQSGSLDLPRLLQPLDFTPKGRNESDTMNWVRHHDRYKSNALSPVSETCGGCE